MNDMEKIKHLEFVQNIVTRMNANSFQIKSWSITITAALLALYAGNSNSNFIIVAIFPIVLFWLLDTYYLQQERKFRAVYNNIAGLREDAFKIRSFEMAIENYKGGRFCYFRVMCSKTILPLYLLPICGLLIGWFILTGRICING
jgi:hypothetical protein